MKPVIAIIMGSDSDLPVMQETAKVLDTFSIPYELTIVSAHRTPKRMYDFVLHAEKHGIKVLIAGAGGAAHLPGMVAALTHLPVIGVPIKSKSLDGLDSLLSIAQMPPGVPVATVAVNGAQNAGLLAIQILGVKDIRKAKRIKKYKQELKKMVEKKAILLEAKGYKKYLVEETKK